MTEKAKCEGGNPESHRWKAEPWNGISAKRCVDCGRVSGEFFSNIALSHDVTDDWLRMARESIHRLSVIRDAFLEGRDKEAVGLIKQTTTGSYRIIGLPSRLITPEDTAYITITPQRRFRPTFFGIDARVAGFFRVHDIKIGTTSQFIGPSPIFGNMFSAGMDRLGEYRPGLELEMQLCEVGQDISVTIGNISSHSQFFCGAFIGYLHH